MTALTTVSTLTAMRLATEPADKRKFFVQSKLGVIFTGWLPIVGDLGIILVRGNIVNLLTKAGRPSWTAIPFCALSVMLKECAISCQELGGEDPQQRSHDGSDIPEDRHGSWIATQALFGMLLFPMSPSAELVIAVAVWMGLQLRWIIVDSLKRSWSPSS